MPESSYSISFLLGSPDISGGTYVIFEHASRLLSMGHQVSIVTKERVSSGQHAWHPGAEQLEWLTLDAARNRQFDLVFATWWESPYLLAELAATHYAYFVQSIESRFFKAADPTHHDNRDLDIWKQYCEATYGINIPIITEATWIKDYLFDNYNHHACLVHNGIRKDLYTCEGETVATRESGKLRVLVEGPVDVPYKNVPTSIALCQQAQVDEIWLLTSSDISEYPGVDRVFSRVSIHETPAIYRSCDVLVKLSYIEGMFGPPLEMFHCGGTSIVYDVTGHDEYIVHGENSYVVGKDNEATVVDYLVALQENPLELERLKAGAGKTARSWPDWHESSVLFNAAVHGIMTKPPTSRAYLQKWAADRVEDNASRNKFKDVETFSKREQENGRQVIDNFVQVYFWAEEDGLDPNNFRWAHYTSGTESKVSLEIPIAGFPFWLRVDPSVQVGAVEVRSIRVINTETDEVLINIDTMEAFDQLWAGGTMRRVPDSSRVMFYSYGNDPQFILPAINSGEVGQILLVELTVKETGIQALLDTVSDAGRNVKSASKSSVRRFGDRLRRKISRTLNR